MYQVLLKPSSQETIITNLYVDRSGFLVDTKAVNNFELHAGPKHRARWMAKAIYAMKIFLFKTQFKLTARESKKITDLALFFSLVYVKQWNEAPRRIRAPLNGIKFLSVLKTYPKQAVASKAHAIFSRHLWFLSEHLVAIALLMTESHQK